MAINNTSVVNTTSKYIVKSTGIGSESGGILVEAEKLTDGNNESLVSLIECYYLIEGTGKMSIYDPEIDEVLTLTGKGKYGLRPGQLKVGNDKVFYLTTDSNIKSYLLVTEFRRNN